MKRKISKAKSIQRTKLLTEFVICAGIIAAAAFLISGAMKRSQTIQRADNTSNIIEVTEPTTIPPEEIIDPNKVIYESLMVDTKSKYRGDLILVNEDHQYFGGDEDLVSIIEKNNEKGISFFSALADPNTDEEDDLILASVYDPMEILIEDYYNLYWDGTLIIYGAYRSTERQQEILDEKGPEIAAKPGHSEHETGYAFDFSETVNYDYMGIGNHAWINENCYKYGFIVRYTEEKEDITKIPNEPWHFRYVGIPHAYYMTKNNLCLEEYIELIGKNHPYDGEHLTFTDHDNRSYEVYFVPSDDGAEKTTVPVPAGKEYNISGNNIDGFIVTVYNDGTPVVKNLVSLTDDSDEDTTEDSSEDATEDFSKDTIEDTNEVSTEDDNGYSGEM
ncbi:MAG: M15 family metallopeptidase [Ruminococcus sp.]|nr:M15 family metallopeptidase [Ruminococcus sp.]